MSEAFLFICERIIMQLGELLLRSRRGAGRKRLSDTFRQPRDLDLSAFRSLRRRITA